MSTRTIRVHGVITVTLPPARTPPLRPGRVELASCDMATLYLPNVPDEVIARLPTLAAREGRSDSAFATPGRTDPRHGRADRRRPRLDPHSQLRGRPHARATITMYASYIMRRTQIYLGDEQDAMLSARARATGTTKSALIRDAIDALLTDDASSEAAGVARMRAAVTAATGVAPHLPRGADYVDDLRADDADRAAALDVQRSG